MGDTNSEPAFLLPTEFPYDFASSTQPESNQDHFLTELTRQFALSTLIQANKKKWSLSGSPPSVLSPVFSNGSPNGFLQGPSSPTGPSLPNDHSWDLICAAAGQVNMWKIRNQGAPSNNFTHFQSSANHHLKKNNGSLCGLPHGCSNKGSRFSGENSYGFLGNMRCGKPVLSGWPSLMPPKQQCSGFVGDASLVFSGDRRNGSGSVGGLKRKCAGTGVFLPRRCPDPIDSRVKSGCPTTSMQGTYDNMMTKAEAQQPLDVTLMRRNAVLAQQWRNGRGMLLPQEWSY